MSSTKIHCTCGMIGTYHNAYRRVGWGDGLTTSDYSVIVWYDPKKTPVSAVVELEVGRPMYRCLLCYQKLMKEHEEKKIIERQVKAAEKKLKPSLFTRLFGRRLQ